MSGNAAAICSDVRQGHKVAWEKAQVPALDVNMLISLVASVLNAKENRREAALAAAKQLAEEYGKPVEIYLKAFSVYLIENGLQRVKFGEISKLGTEEFAEKLIEVGKSIEQTIAAFCRAQIDEMELINQLGQTGVLEVGRSFIQAAGIDLSEIKAQVQSALGDVNGISVCMISFYASAAAYKMLREAMRDAAIMRDTRMRIEEECAKSIAQMRTYREQMNALVSDSLYTYAETFLEGIAAMDKAILEGDADGFIRGNVAIQEILNYRVQFCNQAEFDALMDSDDAFVL